MINKNYGDSHGSFKVSSKRLYKSPFISKYLDQNTIFGVYANRFYPLSTELNPTKAYWNLKKRVMLYEVPEKPLEISGPDSVKLLETIFCRDVHNLPNNRARYTIACTFDGGILMDGILIRLEEDKFWYVHADGDFETWLLAHSKNLEVSIRDPQSWAIQIQGPNALKVLASVAPDFNFSKFKFFHALRLTIDKQNFLVSRTGWTGELGFEIYTNGPHDDHEALWDYLIKKGKNFGLMTGGLDSMGIRRIEAGILDYGTDMSRANNPFEMGLGSYVNLKKNNFFGKEKLLSMNKKNRFYGVVCKEAIPFSGCEILERGQVVGRTTTGAFSPYLNSGIGYVLFTNQADWVEKKLTLRDTKKNLYDCQISTLPFYDPLKKIPRGKA